MLGASANAEKLADRLFPVMEPLCNILYDVLRPLLVQLQGVDELCELVDILKHEVRAAMHSYPFRRKTYRLRYVPLEDYVPLAARAT